MPSITLIPNKPMKEISTKMLEGIHSSILDEIKTLESTMDSWWKTERQADYRQLLEAARATLKDIENEIARRAAEHLHSLVQRIEGPQKKAPTTPATQNQEGEMTHDRQS